MANEKEIIRMVNYLIDNMSMWHINYARAVLIPSEVEKIIKEHEKFDDLLKKRGEWLVKGSDTDNIDDLETYNQIMNNQKDEMMIQEIDIYTQGKTITIDNEHYSSDDLNEVLNKLEQSEDIKIKSNYKSLYVGYTNVVGYEVTYASSYEETFKNDLEKDL
ncbi:hypothetical protein F867_gp089 [Staphylococcus phage JD007]|uniref:Uncharacterized protein n=1 Tax=Staphylococcus phage JD007 TaxID=1239383 RepID=K7QMM0_9CAUD|nr:hypothetical protein F867_gp089 [Staphylococcus phage JD007]AFV50761.1 hypothetical protein [Staphylococcus phage JD007]